MKRLLAALTISALLLVGCGEGKEPEALLEQAREQISGAESMSFAAQLNSLGEDSVFDCRISLSRSGGETLLEVLEPHTVAGIKARLSDGQTRVEYEDEILVTGDGFLDELSPLGAAAQIARAIEQGFPESLWWESRGEQQLLAIQCSLSPDSFIKIWFDGETLLPVNAELVSGGTVVVKCVIEDFTLEI